MARFSIGGLLYLTAGLSFGFTIGVGDGSADTFDWHTTWLTLATFGLATELLRQASTTRASDGFLLARWLRYAAVVGLAGCVLLQFLLQRGLLVFPEREEFFDFFQEEPFPEAIWLALLIAVATTFSHNQSSRSALSAWRVGYRVVLFSAACLYTALLVQDLGFIHWIVHIATAGIDVAEPLAFQRVEAFPCHEREGFLTYRTVRDAACLLALAATLPIALAQSQRPRFRQIIWGAFVAMWAVLIAFNYWYYWLELPRISPDLASAPWKLLGRDLIGVATSLALVAGWIGGLLTREFPTAYATAKRRASFAGSLPVWLAAGGLVAGGGVPAVQMAISAYATASTYYAATQFENAVEALRYLLRDPEFLLTAALAISGLSVGWAAWRGHEAAISRVPLGRFVATSAMLMLLGLIAIPTLAAYSFAAWLGPWWQ